MSDGTFLCQNYKVGEKKETFFKFCFTILWISQISISYSVHCLNDEYSFGIEGVRDRSGGGIEDVMHNILDFDRALNIWWPIGVGGVFLWSHLFKVKCNSVHSLLIYFELRPFHVWGGTPTIPWSVIVVLVVFEEIKLYWYLGCWYQYYWFIISFAVAVRSCWSPQKMLTYNSIQYCRILNI